MTFAGQKAYLASLDVVGPTVEAVTLNAISGFLGQAFTAYKAKVRQQVLEPSNTHDSANPPHRQDLFAVDFVHILQFMLFTALIAAPNYVFQNVLEHCFPTRTIPKERLQQGGAKDKDNEEELLRKHGRLDIRNTVVKFVLDQSLSATTNTVLFIVVLGLIKGQSFEHIEHALYAVSS